MSRCVLCSGFADDNGLHDCDVTGEVHAVASVPELFEEIDEDCGDD